MMDVHVPRPITDQLRRRGIDALTAFEDGSAELEDGELLERACALGRVLFTQDIRFKALAEEWQRTSHPFLGLIFGHQLHGTIGQFVRDLDLIANATEYTEWSSTIEQIPFCHQSLTSATRRPLRKHSGPDKMCPPTPVETVTGHYPAGIVGFRSD